jgi:2-oxoisovalerate dehydrogenase E2 component (dihydrolipoyl transacylase)
MARFDFRLPDIGEGIAKAEIVAWHVKVGDAVAEDAHIVDMMTDKATVEIETPVAGTVVELGGAPGDDVAIGAMLAVIETPEIPLPAREGPGVGASVSEPATAAMEPVPSAPLPTPDPTLIGRGEKGHLLASPAVRARARDLGIDLAEVQTSDGRVRHADLDAYLLYGRAEGYRPPHASRAWPDETVKVIGLRRRIAENMAASKRHIPHFSYVEEFDVTALEAMRAQLNANRGNRPKLTLLPFLIVGICKVLPDYPMLNAHFDDEAGVVTRHGHVHLGIATQTDAGLMVPVIRDAQDRNVWQLAAEITRLAEAARTSQARSEDLSGSTLTLTSLGPLGGIATTPVINRPEVAIIGPNRIVERPVFEGDKIVRAKLMNLSISCDHRVVDGWDAASFVQALKRTIEAPALLFQD